MVDGKHWSATEAAAGAAGSSWLAGANLLTITVAVCMSHKMLEALACNSPEQLRNWQGHLLLLLATSSGGSCRQRDHGLQVLCGLFGRLHGVDEVRD